MKPIRADGKALRPGPALSTVTPAPGSTTRFWVKQASPQVEDPPQLRRRTDAAPTASGDYPLRGVGPEEAGLYHFQYPGVGPARPRSARDALAARVQSLVQAGDEILFLLPGNGYGPGAV